MLEAAAARVHVRAINPLPPLPLLPLLPHHQIGGLLIVIFFFYPTIAIIGYSFLLLALKFLPYFGLLLGIFLYDPKQYYCY